MEAQPSDPDKVPLNSASLRHADASSRVDKDRFVEAYIQSQRSFLHAYATEGRDICVPRTSGPSNAKMVLPRDSDCRHRDLEPGFDTPILKPRVPLVMEKCNETPAHSLKSLKHKMKNVKNARNVKNGGAKENRPTKKAAEAKSQASSIRGYRAQQTLEMITTMKKQVQTRKAATTDIKKRARSPSTSDEEHVARLAERRARRRRRRDIVEPSSGHCDSEASERPITVQEGKKTTKAKKNKGLSMSAGLALMHGFSAKNIGNNRLTVAPDKVLGVFNKGKASLKVPVKLPAKSRASMKHFSESQFLNRTGEDAASTIMSDDSSSNPISSLSLVSKRNMKPTAAKRTPTSMKGRSKRREAHTDLDSALDSSGSRHDISENASPKIPKNQQDEVAESVVWDIELDGNHLEHGSDSSEQLRSRMAVTVVMDTSTKKWDTNAESMDMKAGSQERMSNCQDGHFAYKHVLADESKSSSLAPSQSASQVCGRSVDGPAQPTVSRFFDLPSSIQDARDQPTKEDDVCSEDFRQARAPTVSSDELGPLLTKAPSRNSPSMPHEKNYVSTFSGSLAGLPDGDTTLSLSISTLEREIQALDADDYTTACALGKKTSRLGHAQEHLPLISSDYEACLGPAGTLFVNDPQLGLTWSNSVCDDTYEEVSRFEDVDVDQNHQSSAVCENPLWQQQVYDAEEIEVDEDPVYGLAVYDVPMDTDEKYDTAHDDSDVEGPAPESSVCYYTDPGEEICSPACSLAPRPMSPWNDTSSQIDRSPSPSDVSAIPMPRFSQGRALLLGLSEQEPYPDTTNYHYTYSSAEEHVAKTLRGHWLPQRL